jgi:hypothetical protein
VDATHRGWAAKTLILTPAAKSLVRDGSTGPALFGRDASTLSVIRQIVERFRTNFISEVTIANFVTTLTSGAGATVQVSRSKTLIHPSSLNPRPRKSYKTSKSAQCSVVNDSRSQGEAQSCQQFWFSGAARSALRPFQINSCRMPSRGCV